MTLHNQTKNQKSKKHRYDLVGLSTREAEQCDGIDESGSRILKMVDFEIETEGTPASSIVLGGFSQGGALALHAGLQREGDALAGVLCMSGYLPKRSAFGPTRAGLATKTGLFHGKDDPVVEHRHAESTLATLQSAQINVTLKSYATLGHSASIEELLDVITWLETLNNE